MYVPKIRTILNTLIYFSILLPSQNSSDAAEVLQGEGILFRVLAFDLGQRITTFLRLDFGGDSQSSSETSKTICNKR